MSCGNQKSTNLEKSTNEADSIETVVEDILDDTMDVVTRGASESQGFGRCSKCYCKKFEGRGETCRNCGHAYKKHY